LCHQDYECVFLVGRIQIILKMEPLFVENHLIHSDELPLSAKLMGSEDGKKMDQIRYFVTCSNLLHKFS
jgi:hypothetical protein